MRTLLGFFLAKIHKIDPDVVVVSSSETFRVKLKSVVSWSVFFLLLSPLLVPFYVSLRMPYELNLLIRQQIYFGTKIIQNFTLKAF